MMEEQTKRQITKALITDYLQMRLKKNRKKILFLIVLFIVLVLPSLLFSVVNFFAMGQSKEDSGSIFASVALPFFFAFIFGNYAIVNIYRYITELIAVKRESYFFLEDKVMDCFSETSRSKYGKTVHYYFVFERYGRFEVDAELSNAYNESVIFDELYLLCIGKNKPRILHVYNKELYDLSDELRNLL